ncbi:Ankyrin repeat-containing domain [Phytophthora cactorum]|nr:Ankyrin repeat-containing domain [Phytophthora cactorum]
MLQWLQSNQLLNCTTSAMNGAAGNGHLEIVKWLHRTRDEVVPRTLPGTGTFAPETMDIAAQIGHLPIVRWLHENRSEGCTTCALDSAASNSHLSVVLFLLEHRNEGFSSNAMVAAQNIEVQCSFSTSGGILSETCRGQVSSCLRCLAEIALREGNIEILDWLNQLGLELRTTIPIRDAVTRGDVKLLQWFYWNRFEILDSDLDLLELAGQNGQLDAARWLSKHGLNITSLNLIEEAARNRKVPLLRWLAEHGPPLNFRTAKYLTMEYRHVDISWWVSESDRALLALEALQKGNRKLLWWILTRTRFEDASSQQSIRDGIKHAPNNILLWIQESLSDFEEYKWCFAISNKRCNSDVEPIASKRKRTGTSK